MKRCLLCTFPPPDDHDFIHNFFKLSQILIYNFPFQARVVMACYWTLSNSVPVWTSLQRYTSLWLIYFEHKSQQIGNWITYFRLTMGRRKTSSWIHVTAYNDNVEPQNWNSIHNAATLVLLLLARTVFLNQFPNITSDTAVTKGNFVQKIVPLWQTVWCGQRV
jgi:hypothetical protein